MTRSEMLAKCRLMLDESSAGFWTDAEIYTALKDGEYDSLSHLASVFDAKRQIQPELNLFEVLRPLITIVSNFSFGSTGIGLVALPADFFLDFHVEYSHNSATVKASRKRTNTQNRYFNSENAYLASSASQYFHWFDVGLNFETVISGIGAYRLTYIKKPTGISASQDPMIGFQAHDAICYYAVAQMLLKDQRPQEAMTAFGIYMNLLQKLYF